MQPFSFRLIATDGAARTGEIATAHGLVRTPAFMPVGTQAAIKGVHHDDVRASGADIVLGNTYHLMLRPCAERVAALGGLHAFMHWPLPILTDSGGYQVMSLSALRKVTEAGVTFRSHIDGAMVELTPERAIEVQILLGSDIAMQLDELVGLPAERAEIERAMQLSLRWAERCKRAFERALPGRALFGIVQGGDDQNLREQSARTLTDIGFHGYAIGGLAVGEPQEVMLKIVGETTPAAAGRPAALSHGRRHAVGYSRAPSRAASICSIAFCRHAMAATVWRSRASDRSISAMRSTPRIRARSMRRAAARPRVISRALICITSSRPVRCSAARLLSIVNLYYYQDLMAGTREAIAAGRFADYAAQTQAQWAAKIDKPAGS